MDLKLNAVIFINTSAEFWESYSDRILGLHCQYDFPRLLAGERRSQAQVVGHDMNLIPERPGSSGQEPEAPKA